MIPNDESHKSSVVKFTPSDLLRSFNKTNEMITKRDEKLFNKNGTSSSLKMFG